VGDGRSGSTHRFVRAAGGMLVSARVVGRLVRLNKAPEEKKQALPSTRARSAEPQPRPAISGTAN